MPDFVWTGSVFSNFYDFTIIIFVKILYIEQNCFLDLL